MEKKIIGAGINDGIYAGMPMDVYHADPAISKSGLSDFAQSPAHYVGRRLEPKEPSKAMDLGSLVHAWVLEPDTFEERYTTPPDGLGSKQTKAYKEWAAAQTKIIVDQDTLLTAGKMVANVRNHPVANMLTSGGMAEVGAFWTDPERNIRIKVRPDYLPGAGIVTDLKTTRDASPFGFGAQSFNLKYHWSAELTLRVLSRATNKVFSQYYLVAVENTPPHEVAVYLVTNDQLVMAREELDRLLWEFAGCYSANEWPGYSKEVLPLEWPHWAWKKAAQAVSFANNNDNPLE
jgi:exodeoxyribonuclease VIII